MTLRFSKRLKIAPGIRLNLSRSGLSASLGGRGAWLTLGRRGARVGVSLPGTGLSYAETLGGPPPAGRPAEAPVVASRRRWPWLAGLAAFVVLAGAAALWAAR